MLSNSWHRAVLKIKKNTLCPIYNALSTVPNVKQDASSSSVNSLQKEWSDARPFDEMPRVTRYEFIRGFLKGGEFEGLPFTDVMSKCKKRLGDIYLLPGVLHVPPAVVTFNSNDFRKIFRTEGAYPYRPGGEVMVYYRKSRKDKFFEDWQGLFGQGEEWAKFRSAVNPVLLQPRNARSYVVPMREVNDEFMQRIRDIRDPVSHEVPENFVNEINCLAFESVGVVAVNRKFNLILQREQSPEAKLLFESINNVVRSFFDFALQPSVYQYIRTPAYRRLENSLDTIFDITSKYVHEALEKIEHQTYDAKEKSMLAQLLEKDQKIAVIMAMDMFLGAVDTTTSALAGIMLCIATNPEKQNKLRNEILSVVPKGEPFTVENMKNLPYLRACIKEGMRVYPVGVLNFRCAGEDVALSGYKVPKGTCIYMNSRDLLVSEHSFPRPKEFIPERWLRANDSGNSEKLQADELNSFAFLPFGFGPRMCAGKRIVDLEMEITIANLVRNFNIEFNHPTDNAFKTYTLNEPAIPLKFKFSDL